MRQSPNTPPFSVENEYAGTVLAYSFCSFFGFLFFQKNIKSD